MADKKIIIGSVGEIASGKGAISKYLLTQYHATEYRFSDILKDILIRVHLDVVRENLAKLSFGLRKYYGQDILAYALAQDIKDADTQIISVDGIRRVADLKYLKEMDNFVLVYVEADLEKRYERLIGRTEKQDDQNKTFEEFKKDHELETEVSIRELKDVADVIIDNNGTVEELHKQIDKLIEDKKAC
ncbi:MAG: hypothetical protein U9Q12_02530 [Patescibacteria group bacterium]|nr:hypothetical protein [Patescibacteria group bacterium]